MLSLRVARTMNEPRFVVEDRRSRPGARAEAREDDDRRAREMVLVVLPAGAAAGTRPCACASVLTRPRVADETGMAGGGAD
ncbi:MAG: hypothetical protein ACLR3C_13460 [Eggerthella lenta]